MAMVSLSSIVRYCDRTLRTNAIEDYEGALNGLQVENSGKVSRIAAAVDASLATVGMAVDAGADLLVVHHGLFWSSAAPWTGRKYELLRLLLDHDVAVYSAHLPLDAHSRIGNNVLLCRALGIRNPKPFLELKGVKVGRRGELGLTREQLTSRLAAVTGNRVTVLPGGPARCRRIGVVTGGAGTELAAAAREGVDTFITGEGPHWTFALAEECQINVLYAGHYATETFGVQALAKDLAFRFRLPWLFLDHPTGL